MSDTQTSQPAAAQPPTENNAAGSTAAPALNINAKPFTPSFGAPPLIGAPTQQTTNQQPQGTTPNHQKYAHQNFSHTNTKPNFAPPLPTPPMPHINPFGMGMNPYNPAAMMMYGGGVPQTAPGGFFPNTNNIMGPMLIPGGGALMFRPPGVGGVPPHRHPIQQPYGQQVPTVGVTVGVAGRPPHPTYQQQQQYPLQSQSVLPLPQNATATPPSASAAVSVGGARPSFPVVPSYSSAVPMTNVSANASFGNNSTHSQFAAAVTGTPSSSAVSAPTPSSRAAQHHPQAAAASTATTPAAAKKPPLTFPRKVAFLILGGRGSGKTTQCEKLAKHFNLLHIAGGNFAADKKLPFFELERVLSENFVEGVEIGKAKCKKAAAAAAETANNTATSSIRNSPNANDVTTSGGEATNNSNAPTPADHNSPSAAVDTTTKEKEISTVTTTNTSSQNAANTKNNSIEDSTPEYNGVVLDRLIGLHEYDAYYLDAILRRFGMAVELVFLLMLDSEMATQRAVARGDGKPVDHARQMAEHRIQYAAVNGVYSPLKILHCVECDNMPVDAITRALDRVIDTHYRSNAITAATPPPVPHVPHHPYTQGRCKVVTDYRLFYQLRGDMLIAVHGSPKPPIVCPASLMSGIADGRMFVNTKQARPLVNSFATLKADGQRVLLFKHSPSGEIYGINGIFHFIFHFTPYFEQFNIVLPPKPDTFVVPEHGIEWVIDTECFSVEGKTQIAVFDYLYFFGDLGSSQMFEKRLEKLTDFFGKITIGPNSTGTKSLYGPAPLFLKQYVSAPRIREILPDPKNPPFPIDGVVFQHFGRYKFGRDNAIYKWKPREMCTVDFRLDKAVGPQTPGGEWSFVPMVGEDKEEVMWPNAQIRATDADARRFDLCDGAIAECIKRAPPAAPNNNNNNNNNNANGATGSSSGSKGRDNNNHYHGQQQHHAPPAAGPTDNTFTIWDFVRIRPEKPTPNKMEIAKAVNSMEHITFDELATNLETLAGVKR